MIDKLVKSHKWDGTVKSCKCKLSFAKSRQSLRKDIATLPWREHQSYLSPTLVTSRNIISPAEAGSDMEVCF